MGKEKKEIVSTVIFVKNLPYDTSQTELETTFSKYGEIKRCFLVKDSKAEGKCKGIGYITFLKEDSMHACAKAKVVLRGRKLQTMPAKPRINQPTKKEKKKVKNESNIKEEKEEEDEGSNNDDDAMEIEENDKIPINSKALSKFSKNRVNKDYENEGDNDNDKMDDEDDKDDEEDEDDDDDDEEDEGDDEKDDEDDEEEENEFKTKKVVNENDADEGKTLFIRNLSFDATEMDLVEFFEEFGGLSYCRVVVNPETEFSRGTAFVKFRKKEDSDACLQQFEEDESVFMLMGRKMGVVRAVVKGRAVQMATERKNNEVVRRASQKNLHLVKLTLVRPGTKEAAGMSKEDGRKRMKVEEMTKDKLRNPNIFVSETRICVRNIPVTMVDKDLRKIFIEAVKDKKTRITECRVMRDLKRVNSDGVGKSRGYAFISFNNPQHAMQAVLATNNNPNIFSEDKRPIVEFSLENKSALEMKKKREEKSKLTKQSPKKTYKKPPPKRQKKSNK